uniref:Discoidin, CUB and LCCL domain containing 1 n=1 Tax=Sinocyclocheilus grahami TaxID=75366 RepID=A0A672PLV1_SINGR
TIAGFGYFVKNYKIEYKERMSVHHSSVLPQIFEGNTGSLHQTRNTFHPSIVARSIRIVPQQWHRTIAMRVQLLGCPYVKPIPGAKYLIFVLFSVTLVVIIVPTILLVVLLLVGICVVKIYQLFPFSFSSAEYQQPLMLGTDTVSRKGSTFRPMDTEAKDKDIEATSHYDHLQTGIQYALPLTNQEPEYATPIIERHTFRKDPFLPDPSYSIPGVVLNKSPSFRAVEGSNCRKVIGGLAGGYQAAIPRSCLFTNQNTSSCVSMQQN